MEEQNRRYDVVEDLADEVDIRNLELCFLTLWQRKMANCLTSFLVCW